MRTSPLTTILATLCFACLLGGCDGSRGLILDDPLPPVTADDPEMLAERLKEARNRAASC